MNIFSQRRLTRTTTAEAGTACLKVDMRSSKSTKKGIQIGWNSVGEGRSLLTHW